MNGRQVGVVLAVWSFGFACVHVAWATGWRGGVPADAAPISERPWFLAYDLLAAVLMFGAAAVAARLASDRATPMLIRLTVVGSVLALGRGLPALALDVISGQVNGVGTGADVWFTVAGVLGLALARSARSGNLSSGRIGREWSLNPRPLDAESTTRREAAAQGDAVSVDVQGVRTT